MSVCVADQGGVRCVCVCARAQLAREVIQTSGGYTYYCQQLMQQMARHVCVALTNICAYA